MIQSLDVEWSAEQKELGESTVIRSSLRQFTVTVTGYIIISNGDAQFPIV